MPRVVSFKQDHARLSFISIQGNTFFTMYNASVSETRRDGTFYALLREPSMNVVSRDPEHDLCAAMVDAGLPDGPSQFWRNETPTLRFKSVHTAARYRISMGETFPLLRVKRGTAENLRDLRMRSHGDGQTGSGGYYPSQESERACGWGF